jgi:hypothetical protein
VALTVLLVGAFVVGLRVLAPGSTPDAGPSPLPSPSASVTSGIPPAQAANGYECPATARIAAYATLAHHYFDPTHPRHPSPSVEPDRCFRDQTEAEAAGYSKGLLPSGWYEVDGLYLTPNLGGHLQRSCLNAATRLGFAVPCPTLLPASGAASGLPRCGTASPANPGCIVHGAFFLQYSAFPGQGGFTVGGSGLVVMAYRTKDAGAGSFLEWLFLCGGTHASEERSLTFTLTDGPATTAQGRFIECNDLASRSGGQTILASPSGGQTILYWRQNGITYGVSLHGNLTATKDVLLQIAQSVFLVPVL